MGQTASNYETYSADLDNQLEKHKEADYTSRWTFSSREKLTDLENRFFKSVTDLPFKQSIYGGLGTVTINENDSEKPVLVLVHGYAICNAMWALVVDRLSPFFRLYLVEMHGHGRSDRIDFPDEITAEQAESLMANYLERWRKEIGLEEKFLLAGHSLGAMVSWRYAAEYSDRLKHLVMISPAGIPTPPPGTEERLSNAPFYFRFIFKKWREGTSLMDVIRSFGPMSRPLVGWIIRKRMSWYPETSAAHKLDVDLLVDLLHQSWCLPRSGEVAMNAMLDPGAFAKRPILERVEKGELPPLVVPPSVKISFIYGHPDMDWMKSKHGYARQSINRVIIRFHMFVLHISKGGLSFFHQY